MDSGQFSYASKLIKGKPEEWVVPFNIEEYVDNPPMIRKLHERQQFLLIERDELRFQVENLKEIIQEIKIEKELAEQAKNLIFIISFLGAIFASIGTNLITANWDFNSYPFWLGIFLILSALSLEYIAFVIQKKQKAAKRKKGETS